MTTIETRAECELFERLYRAYHRALVRFLARMTRCPERAEDLAQVAWLKLLQARARGTCAALEEAELRAYLFTVARNAFLDEYTRKGRRTPRIWRKVSLPSCWSTRRSPSWTGPRACSGRSFWHS